MGYNTPTQPDPTHDRVCACVCIVSVRLSEIIVEFNLCYLPTLIIPLACSSVLVSASVCISSSSNPDTHHCKNSLVQFLPGDLCTLRCNGI